MLSDKDIEKLVKCPSVGSIYYQALTLRKELSNITEEEYPVQTCQIRDIFLCLVDRICDLLKGILTKKTAGTPPQAPIIPDNENDIDTAMELGGKIYVLYSFLRFLKTSSPHNTPPGIQLALAQLTKRFFPKFGRNPICLVIPQWEYNLGYDDLSWELNKLITLDDLNPNNNPHIKGKNNFLPALWKKWKKSKRNSFRSKHAGDFPDQLGVLSFAALDTHDTLLFPLLAHELGHFIDFSHKPTKLYLSAELKWASRISRRSVSRIIGPNPYLAQVHNKLVKRASVCLREIIADLLAVRMMGVSFFIAQAETLKLIDPLPNAIEPSGYPGFKFRLSIIFNHMLSFRASRNPLSFFQNRNDETSSFVVKYLAQWKHALESPSEIQKKKIIRQGRVLKGNALKNQQKRELELLLENAVRSAIPKVYSIVKQIIPDAKCAKLSDVVFKRLRYLRYDLPPSCELETAHSFSEILSAAWIYQLQYGEENEWTKKKAELKYSEYSKTNRLVMKAIQLIPVCATEVRRPNRKVLIQPDDENYNRPRGVLSKDCILERISLDVKEPSSIQIIPPPRSKADVNTVSVNLHLGNWFSIARKTRLLSFRVGDKISERLMANVAREEIFVPYGRTFIIHPGDLVLGVTLEFVALPGNVMAYVEGKSKIGRMGLIIATASKIDPGFHGVIVLELANAGTVPLEIQPGSVVAQLIFQGLNVPLEKKDFYRGEYYCQIKPIS